ncbi:unnamed protein product [Spirodela intermedia]|uniref:Ionotropic glutamate receptor C-terminal domain-containing protein n=1 Tax=Spirodela intermedia TaxID=51605 RepID=A0ABN7E898_SPIIN|nr:unnamed protein product [Spirodela intermedia]
MVVPITDGQSKSAWVFIKPLSGDLWLASGCFVVFTGLVVWFLEHRVNEEFRGVRSNQVGTVFYFAFSTLVFAHREKVVSNFSRFVVIIWVFVVLILTSSYTASLTSMLTVQQLQPTVSDLSDLIKRNERVGYLNDSFMPELLKQLKVNNNRIIAYSSPDEYGAAALDKGTANGGAGAIVDEIPYLKVFLSSTAAAMFPKGSPFLPDVSRAVLNVTEGRCSRCSRRSYMALGSPGQELQRGVEQPQVEQLPGALPHHRHRLGGALLLFLVFFFYNNPQADSILRSDNSPQGKFLLLLKLFDEKDARKEAETRGGEETTDINGGGGGGNGAAENPNHICSQLQSPSSMSNHTYGNVDDDDDGARGPRRRGMRPPQGNRRQRYRNLLVLWAVDSQG